MTAWHGFGGLPCERNCRGLVMAESSSAWRRLSREKQAVMKRVPMLRLTLLAFTNGVAIHVICRRPPRAGASRCKNLWYEIRESPTSSLDLSADSALFAKLCGPPTSFQDQNIYPRARL